MTIDQVEGEHEPATIRAGRYAVPRDDAHQMTLPAGRPLEYSSGSRPRRQPRWIAALTLGSILTSGLGLLMALGGRAELGGLHEDERRNAGALLVLAAVCAGAAAYALRGALRAEGRRAGNALCIVGISLASAMIAAAIWALVTGKSLSE